MRQHPPRPAVTDAPAESGVKLDASRFFIDRPIFAAVLSIVIFVAGLLAIPVLPLSEYPDVAPPTVQVRAVYPGANPTTLSQTVAAPLEEAINGVDDMIYMKSVAASDGVLALDIVFETGTDVDKAQVQVQNRVSQALPRLPEAVRQLGVSTTKSSPNLTMVVFLKSTDGRYDQLYLRNYILLNIRDELNRVEGVGQVFLFGGGDYAMRIWLDPEKAAARGISAGDVVRSLREQNVQVSAGSIGAPPQPGKSDLQIAINAQGRLQTVEEFAAVVVKTGPRGELTRIGDIARVELGASEYSLRSLSDGQRAVAIPVFEAPGANSLQMSADVRKTMERLAADFPPGVTWSVDYDPTVFVRHSIESVVTTLLEAVLLVVFVVVLFLQTWRASIIPLLAVPVSIVGTFAVLLLLGFSINTLTLFGLVLAIGIVVDDAIVVVENVERNIEAGFSPREAAHRAMSEVSGPIIAIGLVLTAVFVPIAFLGGVTGQFYRQFAATIAISTIISMINSLTLSPALAAVLLRGHDAPKDRLSQWIDRAFGWLFRPFNRVFHRAGDTYAARVATLVGHRRYAITGYAVALVLAVFAFRAVPAGFIPTQDKQYLFAGTLLPEGASLDRTEVVTQQMTEIAQQIPGVSSIVALPGFNALQFANTPNSATVFIGLAPPNERELTAVEIVQRLNMAYSVIKEGLAFVLMPPPVITIGNAAGFEMYVQDRGNLGFAELNSAVQGLTGRLRETPGFDPFSILSSYQPNVPQLEVIVDRTKAKQQGVLLSDLFETLQVYLGSTYVNDFNLLGRTYMVYAQADAQFRDEVADIQRLKVRNATGEMVPLGGLVTVKQSFGPDPVVRFNGYPAADVSGGANPAMMSSAEAIQTAARLATETLPSGMSFQWSGLSYQQVNQGNAALFVYPLCVLFVFLVLAALYESWALPLAVILIVPLCLLSAIGGTWLINLVHGLWLAVFGADTPPTFLDNNIFTQIGLVVLMGLACKNAILIVEFARELEHEGRDIIEAALEACRLRLRPILMTSFAFIMGVLPLVFASGAGAEVRYVMGVTVFLGMLGVTFFGLFLTPVFYVLMRRLATRKQRRAARLASESSHG
ncbi:MAG: multidrug efflux RND transporter permease subunit [Sinobacteraceae bacterium]|nr:multidrug efflux RND transporter permease subunit [Nevskiaceae bacterium]